MNEQTKQNEQLNKVEMKGDGHDADRFESMLKTVVSVPKEDVKEFEEQQKVEKDKRAKA